MISEESAKSYCKDDISLIENYDKAISDTTKTWHCHHRRETIFSRKDLIEIGEYYNRPACELIFLTKSEHRRLHKLGKNVSAETRKMMSEAHKGKIFSESHKKKISEALKGKHHSDETRQKLSEANKGKHHSEETRKKISESIKGEKNPMYGKHRSADTCKKIAEANKGKHHSAKARKKMSESRIGKHYPKLSDVKKGLHLHWYNNGVKSILAKTCPEGFVKGRIKL